MDLGSIWGRFSVLGRSWEGLGWVLGGLGVAIGAQDRFSIDFGSILRPVLGPKTDQNRSKIDAKMHSNCASVFGSIFDGFWGLFGQHFWVMLGIIWRIGDISKIIKNLWFLNEFSWFGGSKLASFSYVFGVSVSRSFSDRLGVGFGVDFGAVWSPKWDLC